jgi:DNA-binding CsgD family transcriptional regulator/tetratricopeptide (TPR) repeat protein
MALREVTSEVGRQSPAGEGRVHGLLEREAELAVLDEALASARAGSGRLVVVWGEAGIGKSELLGAARERAAAAGMLVLGTCGHELEREFAFGAALRLVEPVLEGLGAEARETVFAERAATAGPLFDGFVPAGVAGGTDHGYSLVHGLRWLVVNLTRLFEPGHGDGNGSALVVLDDAHWSDDSSLRFLAHLSAGIEALPVTVVVAARSHEPDAPTDLLDGLAGAVGARTLRLAPLSQDASALMVRSVCPDAAPAFARACARASGGNPFYLGELLAAACADGLAASAESAPQVERLAPESVVRSVILRMAKLPHGAATLAGAVSVLGDGALLRHAGALAGLDEETAELAADTLAAAHILRPGEPLRFVHPLIGAAIHADLPALARSRLHRRAADLLDAEATPAETVAAHLLVSRPAGDRRAVAILTAAAARAAGRGEHQAARRFIERALAEPPPPEDRAGLAVELALAEAAVGAPDAVARVRDTLVLVGDRRQRAHLLGVLARLEFARSNFAAAAEAADAALAELDATDPLARHLLATRLVIGGVGPGAGETAAARFAGLLAADEPPADPGLLALLAGAVAGRGGTAREVRELARKALDGLGGDDGFYGVITGCAVMALIFVDELDLAAVAIDRALDNARDTGSLIALATASHWQAELLYRQGALADSIANSRETLEVCSAGWDMCSSWVVPLLVHAHIDRGETGVAAQVLETSKPYDDGSVERLLALGARGRLTLAQGDAEAALRDLKAAGGLADRLATPPTVLPWRTWAALAALQLADRGQAFDLARAQLEQARAIGAPGTLGAALRVAGLVTGGEDGVDLVAEAVTVLESSPSGLERARALIDFGALLRRSGRPVAARDPLRAGVVLAETLGATPLASQARLELSAAGGRRRAPRAVTGPAALTATERHVAELAAQGLTTPQIAQSLYISAKTVDWHLGHAYQKLNVASRRQLPAVLDDSRAG